MMIFKRFIDLPINPEAIERSLMDAIQELFHPSVAPAVKKLGNLWVLGFPTTRSDPAYVLCVQINKSDKGSRVIYWQKRRFPLSGILLLVVWVGTALGLGLFEWSEMWPQLLIAAGVAVTLWSLTPYFIQERTSILVRYAFSHR